MAVSAKLEDARISLKHSVAICKELKGKNLSKAKKFLEDLINRKISLEGSYYTNAAKRILELLSSAEANARFKGLAAEKLFVKAAKADKGFSFVKPKSRWRFRGRRAKAATVAITLEER